MSGRLIVVEGLDGSGKTSASVALARALGARWATTPCAVLRTVRQHFDAAFDHSPVARCLAYAASVVAVGEQAAAWRGQGHDVVIDRYWLSTLAYAPREAAAALRGLQPLVQPADLTLYLSAGLHLRRQRLGGRGGLSAADRATLDPAEDRRLDERFRALAAHPVAGAMVVVDASVDQAGVGAAMVRAVQDFRPSQGALFA